MLGTDFSSLLAPFGALTVVVLLCRWVFSTSHRDRRTAQRRPQAAPGSDFGLLVPVATVRAREDADLLRGVLATAGIRGTVAAAPEGGLSLLVFRSDADRARDLVSS